MNFDRLADILIILAGGVVWAFAMQLLWTILKERGRK